MELRGQELLSVFRRPGGFRWWPCLLVTLLACSACPGAFAYESDQYLNRTVKVEDSLAVLDEQVNLALDRILGRCNPPETRKEVAVAVYRELGGLYWADRIERWAAKSEAVDKYPQTRYRSIYRGMPIWATRVAFLFGVGRSFRINGVMVGSDKFGHFISQGFKYYRRELAGLPEETIVRRGRFAERWLFGQFTTGIYSNADLVANYEGYRFYKSLFDDGVVAGKKAVLALHNGRYIRQRDFTWADHINNYWDEALNPSFNVDALDRRLKRAIIGLCPEYHRHPEYFQVPDDAELWGRYAHIGLKDARQNQFHIICGTRVPPLP